MITVDQPKKERLVGENIVESQDYTGTTDDERPADAPNGSRLFELDESENTLTLLMFFSGIGWKAVKVFNLVAQDG